MQAVWFNGQLTDPDQARVSIFDHGLLFSTGQRPVFVRLQQGFLALVRAEVAQAT